MTEVEVRRIALALPLLALGFACAYDLVILVTSWQQLKRGAIVLAEEAVEAEEAGGTEALLDRAAAGLGRGARVRLLRLGADGAVWRQWRRGSSDAWAPATLPAGCSSGAYIADLELPLPEWLVLAPVARSLVPGLRAGAPICLAKRPADEAALGSRGQAPGLSFLSR